MSLEYADRKAAFTEQVLRDGLAESDRGNIDAAESLLALARDLRNDEVGLPTAEVKRSIIRATM